MTLAELLQTHLPSEVRRSVAMDMKADENAVSKRYNVTFIFDQSWTVGDLIDRHFSASSAKVAFQSAYRGKETVPDTWKVNKAGQKASSVDMKTALIVALGAETYNTLSATMSDAEIVKAIREFKAE